MFKLVKYFLLLCAVLNANARDLEITWPASGNAWRDETGKLGQDEYVEWSRNYQQSNGSLKCTFFTDFNRASRPYLTQDAYSQSQDDYYYKPGTKFNSITCLVGERDYDGIARGCAVGSGIVGHCFNGGGCGNEHCVARRASDSTICAQLNKIGQRYRRVDFIGDINNPRPDIPLYNPKITLKIDPGLTKYDNCRHSHPLNTVVECSFNKSPYASCDEVAPLIKASVKLRFSN